MSTSTQVDSHRGEMHTQSICVDGLNLAETDNNNPVSNGDTKDSSHGVAKNVSQGGRKNPSNMFRHQRAAVHQSYASGGGKSKPFLFCFLPIVDSVA